MFVQENCLVVTEIHFQTSMKFHMISREIPPGVKGECGTQAWPFAPARRGENQYRGIGAAAPRLTGRGARVSASGAVSLCAPRSPAPPAVVVTRAAPRACHSASVFLRALPPAAPVGARSSGRSAAVPMPAAGLAPSARPRHFWSVFGDL